MLIQFPLRSVLFPGFSVVMVQDRQMESEKSENQPDLFPVSRAKPFGMSVKVVCRHL